MLSAGFDCVGGLVLDTGAVGVSLAPGSASVWIAADCKTVSVGGGTLEILGIDAR